MPADKDLARNLQHGLEKEGREKEIFERMTAMNDEAKRNSRDFTQEEQQEWTDLHAEYKALREQKSRDEALGEMREIMKDRNHVPSRDSSVRKDVADMSKREVYTEIGHAAQQLARQKGIAPQIKERDVLMDSGGSGGYLVGEQMLMTIMAVQPEREIIRPRATVIPAGDQPNAAFVIPYFDQSSGVAGGIAFAGRKEDTDMGESDADFNALRLEPKEQSTYLQVGKKTAVNGDAVALGTFLANFFRREKLAKEDYLFFNGTGINEPKGILNAACKLTVTRNTSTMIKFVDVAAMETKQMDDFGYIWVANKRTKDQIATLADAAGNNLIYNAGDIQRGIPASLFGSPIFFTTNVPSLGTEGDLMKINPQYYIIKDGRGWELMVYDVRPEKQLLDYVGLWDVDAASWVANAITFKDGNTYSPFVVLK